MVDGPKVVSMCGGLRPDVGVNQDVVGILSDYLERARSGEVQSVYIAAVHSDTAVSTMHVGCYPAAQLIGELMLSVQKISTEFYDG